MARIGAGVVRVGVAAAVACALLVTAACSATDPLTASFGQEDAGAVPAVERVQEIPPEERGAPVLFEGVDEQGNRLESGAFENVAVVNFWYAGCGPCRAEAPLLEEVWSEFSAEGVRFVGVNIYDQPDTALAFAETYGITYPSIIDAEKGSVRQAFAGQTSLNATPSTLILDERGRVAARIIGQIADASILSTLVKDVLAEADI